MRCWPPTPAPSPRSTPAPGVTQRAPGATPAAHSGPRPGAPLPSLLPLLVGSPAVWWRVMSEPPYLWQGAAVSRCRGLGRGRLGLTPAVPPLGPGCPPGPRPAAPLAPAAAPFVPPASCQAGVRALNAGRGPADGYHRWSVEIGRIGLSHRPLLGTQQKPPNKSTKIPKITKGKCHLSFTAGLCGGSGPAAPLLAGTRANTREVTRVAGRARLRGSGGCRQPPTRGRPAQSTPLGLEG